jgi:hypothetical protein
VNDCACGRPARPLAAILLATPMIAGALASALVILASGTPLARSAQIVAAVLFAAFLGGLLVFALRVAGGRACAGCGRARTK